MPGLNLPYQPLRTSLYSTAELFDGFLAGDHDPVEAQSFLEAYAP